MRRYSRVIWGAGVKRWEGISEFVAVAEHGSFTAAARHLQVSVTHVSRQVAGLEARLNARLLYRSTRRVSLTEAGQLYLQHCQQLESGLKEADQALSQLTQLPTGQLRLTAPVYYGEQVVVPLVNRFLTRYPQLQLDCILTNQRLNLIEQGIDLAIRLGTLEDSGLIARRLGRRTLYVCGSPEYFRRHGQPHTLEELAQHRCLTGSVDYWRFIEQGRERHMPVRGSWRCNSGVALRDAALQGLGLVQLPDYHVAELLEQGALVAVLDAYRQPEDGIWALYPQSRQLSPKVRLLVDYLAEMLQG